MVNFANFDAAANDLRLPLITSTRSRNKSPRYRPGAPGWRRYDHRARKHLANVALGDQVPDAIELAGSVDLWSLSGATNQGVAGLSFGGLENLPTAPSSGAKDGPTLQRKVQLVLTFKSSWKIPTKPSKLLLQGG
jgi:hypothetical protein